MFVALAGAIIMWNVVVFALYGQLAGELYPDFLGKLFHREFIGMTFCRHGTESRVLSVFCNIYPYRE